MSFPVLDLRANRTVKMCHLGEAWDVSQVNSTNSVTGFASVQQPGNRWFVWKSFLASRTMWGKYRHSRWKYLFSVLKLPNIIQTNWEMLGSFLVGRCYLGGEIDFLDGNDSHSIFRRHDHHLSLARPKTKGHQIIGRTDIPYRRASHLSKSK